MRELSLFTGVGGGLLGTHGLLGWECVGAVEWEEYPCRVLRQRQIDGVLNEFPIWHMDIGKFNRRFAAGYTGLVDVITAGFPCQPFSLAGKRLAADDPRNQWPATIDAIRRVKPRWVLLENVPGIVSSGYAVEVITDLQRDGYEVSPPGELPAALLGANHLRRRYWVVANANEARRDTPNQIQSGCDQEWNHKTPQQGGDNQPSEFVPVGGQWLIANAENGNRWADHSATAQQAQRNEPGGGYWREVPRVNWWTTEPPIPGVDDGVPYRVDRISALGNAQVPAVAAAAWLLLTEDLA